MHYIPTQKRVKLTPSCHKAAQKLIFHTLDSIVLPVLAKY